MTTSYEARKAARNSAMESRRAKQNAWNSLDGENLLVLNSTPYRIGGNIPMPMRYNCMLILNLENGVATKMKDKFAPVNEIGNTDYAMLYGLENKLVTELVRLNAPEITRSNAANMAHKMPALEIVYASRNTMWVVRSPRLRSSLRYYQVEQFGVPSDPKIVELRKLDEQLETEVAEAKQRIENMERLLHLERVILDETRAKYDKALQKTTEAERLADHVDLLGGDYSKYRNLVKSKLADPKIKSNP